MFAGIDIGSSSTNIVLINQKPANKKSSVF